MLLIGLALLAAIWPVTAEDTTLNYQVRITPELAGWRFSNGPEFPGAAGTLSHRDGAVRVDGDFSNGGGYVAAFWTGTMEFGLLRFQVRTAAANLAVRFTDADGETHQHFLPLSGNADDWQELQVPVAGSPEHHWGGDNDGKLRQPVNEIGFVVHRGDFDVHRGTFEVTDVRLDEIAAGSPPPYRSPAPEKNFIAPGSREPIQLQLLMTPTAMPTAALAYCYRDYSGKTVAGGTAEFDADQQVISVPPPQQIGYYDLLLPELGIWSGVVVDEPFDGEYDDYFAIDSSFSWGGPPDDEAMIRSYLRLLKQNGIRWNRDRIAWDFINPARNRYHFADRFDLYHRIAASEGIRTLDTFHDTPAWNRLDAPGEYGSNRYPRDLIAAAGSWSAIVRHWGGTLQALEVWNEPDIFFGNDFPGEFVTAFTKAVSRQFAADKIDALVVGGVFAGTREESNFYRLYLENGLLADCDVLSFHTYNVTTALERQMTLLRETELQLAPDRAGIPYWITECGMPWKRGTHRALVPDDLHSAAEIVGKALEFRALGVERYFAFEYKYYDENQNNFGMMDRNFAPMRSMAAYTHLVRAVGNKAYIGDLKLDGAVRSRVFSDGTETVAAVYTGLKERPTDFLTLPAGLPYVRAAGLDGRPLEVNGNRLPMTDGIAYLYLSEPAARNFIEPDTRAMQLYRLAKDFNASPRAAKAVVIQPDYELAGQFYTCYGYDVVREKPMTFRLKFNNFSDRSVMVAPALQLPEGIEAVAFASAPFELPPAAAQIFEFTVKINDRLPANTYTHFQVTDGNGNATPLAISLRANERRSGEILPLTPATQQFDPDSLAAADGWIELDKADWHGWQGGLIDCNIAAKFRVLYTADRLQLQVLVEDGIHSCNYPAGDAWNGDSVQFAVQLREAHGGLLNSSYHEFTAARSRDGEHLFRHIGAPAGLADDGTRLQLLEPAPGLWLYVIDLDKTAIGADRFGPEYLLGFSLLVNGSNGEVRDGYLEWGGGIAADKGIASFNELHFSR